MSFAIQQRFRGPILQREIALDCSAKAEQRQLAALKSAGQ